MQRKRRPIQVKELSWKELAQNYPDLLKPRLEETLIKCVSPDQLACEITQIIKPLGKKPGTPEKVAHHIATELAPRLRHVSTALNRLIANRPVELAAALYASEIDYHMSLVELISTFPEPKKVRARQLTEEQKRGNVKASKNHYERRKRRRYPHPQVGLIEQELGTRHFSWADFGATPTGPFLDNLLKLGEVSMSRGQDCLERLFGVDRHKLPKSLLCVRRGRRVFYDFRAVLECMEELMKNGRWLTDVRRRKLVLSRIVYRAKHIGKPKLAALLDKFFRLYLT